jgi:hypothetical protein
MIIGNAADIPPDKVVTFLMKTATHPYVTVECP